ILLKQEDINLDSTHKTHVSFLSDRSDCYFFSLVTKSDVTNKGCPVAFFIMNSESSYTIKMDAILSTFGTEVQVLVCHWHIRRA
ncbi:hypothetical protein BDC45DRAFT_518045, partial [Circinella umbellata]